jgi:hypothetical protein
MFLSLALLTLFALPAQANDLIEVRPRAESHHKPVVTQQKGSYFNFNLKCDVPRSRDMDEIIDWFVLRANNTEKETMANLAHQALAFPNIQCISHHEAFGFRQESANQYRMNCLASPGNRTVTHLLYFNMRVRMEPEGCASERVIEQSLGNAGRLRHDQLCQFWETLKKNCKVRAEHLNPNTIITDSIALDQDQVEEALEDRPLLREYLRKGSNRRVSSGKNRKHRSSESSSGGGMRRNDSPSLIGR